MDPEEVPEETKKHTPATILIAVLLITVLVVAGAYLYTRIQSQKSRTTQPETNYVKSTPAPTVSPTPADIDGQIDSLDLGDDQTDLNSVQKEIDQL